MQYFLHFASPGSTTNRLWRHSDSPAVVMFKISVQLGYSQAVKYFWNKLTNDEKTASAIIGCERILQRKCTYAYCCGTYCKRCSDIFCFLLVRVTPTQKQELIANEVEKSYDPFCLWVLLLCWPWEHLFMETLEDAWSCFSMFDCKFFVKKFEPTVYTVPDNYKLRETCSHSKEILSTMFLNSPRKLRACFMSKFRQLTAQKPAYRFGTPIGTYPQRKSHLVSRRERYM